MTYNICTKVQIILCIYLAKKKRLKQIHNLMETPCDLKQKWL